MTSRRPYYTPDPAWWPLILERLPRPLEVEEVLHDLAYLENEARRGERFPSLAELRDRWEWSRRQVDKALDGRLGDWHDPSHPVSLADLRGGRCNANPGTAETGEPAESSESGHSERGVGTEVGTEVGTAETGEPAESSESGHRGGHRGGHRAIKNTPLSADSQGPQPEQPEQPLERGVAAAPTSRLAGVVSDKALASLQAKGWITVEALEGVTRKQLSALPGVGRKTVEAIEAHLEAQGTSLKAPAGRPNPWTPDAKAAGDAWQRAHVEAVGDRYPWSRSQKERAKEAAALRTLAAEAQGDADLLERMFRGLIEADQPAGGTFPLWPHDEAPSPAKYAKKASAHVRTARATAPTHSGASSAFKAYVAAANAFQAPTQPDGANGATWQAACRAVGPNEIRMAADLLDLERRWCAAWADAEKTRGAA